MADNLSIKIKYKFINSAQWHSIKFLPDEYFELDSDEKVEWNCIPLYNHAIEYLNIDKKLIQYTKINISNLQANINQIITETFWNQGENRIIDNKISGSTSWDETIVEIKVIDVPKTWEILRYKKENN